MFIPDDYQDAATWLLNSKRIVDRGQRRTMYAGYYRASLVRRSPNTIAISMPWMQGDLITYHSDGTAILQANFSIYGSSLLRSQGTRYLITKLAGFTNVFQRQGKFYITENDYKVTPSKIQGCRTCSSSGKVDTMCWPGHCYEANGNGKCPTHPDAKITNNYWHYKPCEHGRDQSHVLYKAASCYYCGGSGRREYGLKPISLMWDGSPIRIKGGNLVKREPSELEKRIAAYVKMAD